GYVTDNYGWRWIFYLNVPVGLLALVMCYAVVTDPTYLKVEHDKMRTQHSRFDTLGLCLLSITMVCWEVMLSKGQEWDWLGDPFFRVQTLLILFLGCLGALIYRELRIANPLINFRTLLDRNFRSCSIIIFCAFGVLYANTITLPGPLAGSRRALSHGHWVARPRVRKLLDVASESRSQPMANRLAASRAHRRP